MPTMKIEDFLARVVGQGNYLAIAWKRPAISTPDKKGGMIHRFYERATGAGDAGGMLKYMSKQGNETWFALAGYETARQDGVDKLGRPKLFGERTQVNAQSIKAFWIDIDVHRPGDGKVPGSAYFCKEDALQWLRDFVAATGLPKPNLVVGSGYGIHAYWVLEDSMPKADWQPYADAMGTACRREGMIGVGFSEDAARLLRAPETNNLKDPANPAPVEAHALGPDYPNDMVLSKLAPYIGLTRPIPTTLPQPSLGLAGAPSTVFAQAPVAKDLNAAGEAGLTTPEKQVSHFATIATKCEQVKQSMANHGAGDSREVWRMGHLALATFCEDGEDFIHEVSNGDARYTLDETNREFALAQNEKEAKGLGPPTCAYYDRSRGGVCDTCAFKGLVKTPHTLGVPLVSVTSPTVPSTIGAQIEWPEGYRQDNEGVFKVNHAGGKDALIAHGTITDLSVTHDYQEFIVNFIYTFGGASFKVSMKNSEIVAGGDKLAPLFGYQNITILSPQAKMLGECLVAFINNVRKAQLARADNIEPFGYATDLDGKHIGIAVGGTLYRSDGSVEPVPGLQPAIEDGFLARGDIKQWQATFNKVCGGRADLQVLVAAAFGSPLMKFTGEKGLTISAWTPESGAGKSSAMTLGQTVWSQPIYMSSMDDTDNMAARLRGITNIIPSFWDEKLDDKAKAKSFTQQLFTIAQGKEKGRLDSRLQIQPLKKWQTLLIVTNNTQLMDNVTSTMTSSDAGQLRLLEFFVTKVPFKQDPSVAMALQNTQYNCGIAGREFIKHVSINYAKVEKDVLDRNKLLQASWGALTEERLYFAGCSAVIEGATIAKQLGLANFDVQAITDFLEQTVISSRAARQTNSMTTNGAIDVEEVLSQFCNDMQGQKLVTDHPPATGPTATTRRPKEIQVPTGQRGVAFHEIENYATYLSRDRFNLWCKQRGYSATQIVDMFISKMKAQTKRIRWCAQTTYQTPGQSYVIEIPYMYYASAVTPITAAKP